MTPPYNHTSTVDLQQLQFSISQEIRLMCCSSLTSAMIHQHNYAPDPSIPAYRLTTHVGEFGSSCLLSEASRSLTLHELHTARSYYQQR